MKNVLGTITIRNRRRTDDHKENEPKRVGHEMALASLHQFMWVKSLFAAHFCCFDTLTIDDANTGFLVAAGLATNVATQQRIDSLKGPIIPPFPVIVPDVIPGRKIAR